MKIAGVRQSFGLLISIVMLGLAVNFLSLGLPIFAQLIFDRAIAARSIVALNELGLCLFLFICLEGLLVFALARLVHVFAEDADRSMTRAALKKLLSLPLTYFNGLPAGELAAYLREVGVIRDFLTASSAEIVGSSIFMLVLLAVMAYYSVPLALVAGLSIPILVGASVLFRPVVLREHQILSQKKNEFESLVTEGLGKIQTLKYLAFDVVWKKRWVTSHVQYLAAGREARKSAALEETFLKLVQKFVLLAILWVGAYEVLKGAMTFGQLLASYMLALRVLYPSTKLFQIVSAFSRIVVAREKLEALQLEMSECRFDGISVSGGVQSLEFNRVCFSYPGLNEPVLRNLSFIAKRGQFVGIRGGNGAGKTTLLRLLQRHIEPSSGEISVNARGIQEFSICSLRRSIVLVTQNSELFSGTVRENLTGYRTRASDTEIRTACDAVLASEFIAALPLGVNTFLDERASVLSTGQKQRVALARALLLRPSVLILDEATNALDDLAERAIMQRVRCALRGGITIAVSHRAQALHGADIVMDLTN